MRHDLFELLQLPVKPINANDLTAAYRDARKVWFFRQYDPEYLIEAREQLEHIDEAYQTLKDPKKQALLVRELQVKTRGTTRHVPTTDSAISSREEDQEDVPPAINRSKIVRQLLREAEDIVSRTHKPLTTAEQETLKRKAYELGLPFDDTDEVIPRITRQVEP